ncbi:hypothetical protein LTR86_003268 [Recurvomyces mirabilis]|nr:hypothetical protein LTR86_003268 [Recurvomyces mirabilis]
MLELYHRIRGANVTLNGTLAFANSWDFFMKDPSERLENLVATGPYAGTLEAFNTGVKLRTRYEHLLDYAIEHNETALWASGSKRVVETAQYFAAGMYGLEWQNTSRLHIIPETEGRGGDTLTAGKTCFRYLHNADEFGRQYGYRMWNEWREVYLPAISRRLQEQNPAMNFTTSEVYSMQELCGFETIAKGSSKWCDVFTHDEWLQFEYARDVLHYYRTGPGNPYSSSIGWLWLNATTTLLQQGPATGTLFFSFVHDGDIVPMVTALDLLPHEMQHLPATHAPQNRAWQTSQIVPMGGRIIFERLVRGEPKQCWDHADYGYPNHVYCSQSTEEHFVRINVNDGVVALPGCDSGPGRSCPLDQFLERIRKKGEEVGDFREVCGLPRSAKAGIEFLHQ